MKKNMTNRQLLAIQAKEQAFEKALELFKERDFEDVTISDICSYAQISVGSFYNYCKSKEDLIMESYLDFDRYVKNEFDAGQFQTRLEAIRHLIYRQTSGAEALGPKLFSQILRIQLKTNGDYVIEENRPFHVCMRNLVRQAVENGELETERKPDEISSLILRVSRGVLFDWSIRNAPYKAHERALQDIDFFLESIQKDCRHS